MLTMALAGRFVTGWIGDPGAVRSFSVRFTRPVPVPDVVEGIDPADSGAVVELTGTLKSVETVDGVRTGKVDIRCVFEGKTVLGRASATVALPG
jgi:acyl dehydratase